MTSRKEPHKATAGAHTDHTKRFTSTPRAPCGVTMKYLDPQMKELGESIGAGKGKDAPVRLVKGEYLVKLYHDRKGLQKRQHITDVDAFFDERTIQSDSNAIDIVIVSHRWRTQ